MLGQIRKAIYALIGTVLTWFTVVINAHNGSFPVGSLSAYEWLALATAVATALGVYSITNAPKPVPLKPPAPAPVPETMPDVNLPAPTAPWTQVPHKP